jgi:hypothetical protein
MVKRHRDERTRAESRAGQAMEVNVYLPLTRSEMVSMMSIPTG